MRRVVNWSALVTQNNSLIAGRIEFIPTEHSPAGLPLYFWTGADFVGILSITDYVSQIGAPNPLQLSGESVRQEMKALVTELREVEAQITAVKALIHGLSVVYGPGIVHERLLNQARPQPRTNKRGLTPACRSVLKRAGRACAVSEICAAINQVNPELLLRHSKPMASVMSVLRSLERQGQVARGQERGRSVWRIAEPASVQ